MKLLLIMLLLVCSGQLAPAQNAIVEESLTAVDVASATRATIHRREVTTIMNEQAASHALFVCSCSKDERLTSFRGQATDASGHVLRKFKQSELQRTEYSAYLAIDDYKLYLDYTPPSYPVTITYEWTMEQHHTLLEYPWFCPQDDYEVSVRKATYQLTAPQDITVRQALKNISHPVQVATDDKGRQRLTLELHELPALRQEPYSRPLHERLPMAFFVPMQFSYYGTLGSLASWHDYGQWEYSLLKGRDQLPDDVKATLHQLTDGMQHDRDKAEAIYHYLGRHHRYVAILLGIGGQQPAPASEVAKSGFGDCKGLSNLMRAMLQEVGIASNYTTISTQRARLSGNFASPGQLNHAILQVPLTDDTLWLECTHPQLPFGYVHEGIAGHDAIVIDDKGGHFVTLPAYADTLNSQHSTLRMTLNADGSADFSLSQVSRNLQYEHRMPLLTMSEKDRERYLEQTVRAPRCTFTKADIRQCEGASMTLDVAMHSQGYANASGQRLFVPLYPLRHHYAMPASNGERTEPLYIANGYLDDDSIELNIPEGYSVEAMPKDIVIVQPFGRFDFRVCQTSGRLLIHYRLLIKSGSYDKSTYPAFSTFLKSIGHAYSQRVVLLKEYNNRGLVDKKILPHCEYIHYWYDSHDRLVSMQDANLRERGRCRFYLYDQQGNPIQTRQWPADGLRKYTARSFSHTNKPLTELATVYLGNAHATVSKTYTYHDYSDQLASVAVACNNGTPVTVAAYEYDNIGQLKKVTRGGSAGSVSYKYNVRGWLTEIAAADFSEWPHYTICWQPSCGNRWDAGLRC